MAANSMRDTSVSGCWERERDLERKLFQIQDRCLVVLRWLFGLAIPLTIVNISFAAAYAWIYANQYSYGNSDWQRCFVHPNQGATAVQVRNRDGTISFSYHDVEDFTNFLVSAGSYAGRVFVFIIVVFKMAYVGIKDPDVLPYSLFTNIMALLGIIVYREAEPIQPQPQQLSATLLTLTAFIKPDMYTFAEGNKWAPTDCAKAYALNVWFLRSQYVVVCMVLVVLGLTVTCAVLNYRQGKRWLLKLRGNSIPLVLLVVAFGGYVTCFVAKEVVAQTTLYLLKHGSNPITYVFPFHKGELDIVSLTMMMTLGAIGIGTCKGDLEKFKLGAFVAYIHVVLSYPSVLGTLRAYHSLAWPYTRTPDDPAHHDFDLWNDCPSYLYVKRGDLFTPQFEQQVHTVCRCVHASMVGQTVQFAAQHLVVVGCIYILWANRDLPAQRFLRLGSLTPAYLDAAKVGVSVGQPMEGFLHSVKRKKRSWLPFTPARYTLLDEHGDPAAPSPSGGV